MDIYLLAECELVLSTYHVPLQLLHVYPKKKNVIFLLIWNCIALFI